ncbi:hypothetical protein B0J13DRAFT_606637 [Dactylonectria estremocensis]|uniref:Uncharacterized protein n=1 Tax=Dactylonectria estremocensis TaxID=1079267 RepID=A0A9P9F0C9_9HYPO|nr:hypothetical protein B0J13DRAFT_606637 [Dactylonectria estremocensis]
MKFFVTLALLAASVSAASTTTTAATASSTACDADYIVTSCLESEEAKVGACGSTDYGCLCAAYQAVRTCYNNCPNDSRASSVDNQVTVYCQQASLYATTATVATKTSTSSKSATADASDSTATESSATAIESSTPSSTDNAAADLARNTGGLLLAVAGVVAALL